MGSWLKWNGVKILVQVIIDQLIHLTHNLLSTY